MTNAPVISVIIPMYNAEKYIGECLDSILAQTFQDFEVIVVDDCSTDSSYSVVESYKEKFGGRLKSTKTKKNSGSGTMPRNIGITLSRGEYIFFIDNDDTLTSTALEEMHTTAKQFNADVVQCEKYYGVLEKFWYNADFRKKLGPSSYKQGSFVDKPTLITDNLAERVMKIHQRHFIWNIWAQLIRRDFIFENQIKFVGIISDDVIFTICEICSAKRYVLVPSVINYYRAREDSLIHRNLIRPNIDLEKHLHCWITMIKCGVKYLDEFLNGQDFFAQHTELKYMLFDVFVKDMLRYVSGIYAGTPAFALDKILRKEFGNEDNTALTTFIFSELNICRLYLMQAQARIAQLETQLKNSQQRVAELEAQLKTK